MNKTCPSKLIIYEEQRSKTNTLEKPRACPALLEHSESEGGNHQTVFKERM
ncbi:hypothetical protein KC909_01675 [Candidatus Dojkabacteria bacterium]|uniref:Uncharacterized protein n=1 Tax=Candidatus Dojkabacteria bacterium TaxID=2099670 RepID=A0A955L4S5_9BACT|nr:hypothetical protein [Candidatus Dojkabacteria bacterium]